jgi:hypothetical protein
MNAGFVNSLASGFALENRSSHCVHVCRKGLAATYPIRKPHSFNSEMRKNICMMAASAEDVLKNPKWPEKWPFSPRDFAREDESDDFMFYEQPRFVTHIDDAAIAALTKYYAESIPPNSDILDMCSSWISHLPKDLKTKSVVGLGMNKLELERNPQLTSYDLVDLNKNPKLPYPNNSFDVILNVVSVDYLTKPLEVFQEMERVLRPGRLR